jgi:hypothetical protein
MAIAANADVGMRRATPIGKGRLALTGVVIFLLANVGAVVVHGFLLAADYAPFYGTLLRGAGGTNDASPAWQFAFLPVVHLSFTIGLICLFRVARGDDDRWAARALTLGSIAYLIGPAPMWLLWFAEQPWPGTITVKQLGYELVTALVLALTAGALLRRRA